VHRLLRGVAAAARLGIGPNDGRCSACSPVQGIENPNVRCDHHVVVRRARRAGTKLMHGLPFRSSAVAQDTQGWRRNSRSPRPDLRGYGDSSKPGAGEKHASYSKRAMALDMAEVMARLASTSCAVVRHDRGAAGGASSRCFDHADKVTRLPHWTSCRSYDMFHHVNR